MKLIIEIADTDKVIKFEYPSIEQLTELINDYTVRLRKILRQKLALGQQMEAMVKKLQYSKSIDADLLEQKIDELEALDVQYNSFIEQAEEFKTLEHNGQKLQIGQFFGVMYNVREFKIYTLEEWFDA